MRIKKAALQQLYFIYNVQETKIQAAACYIP